MKNHTAAKLLSLSQVIQDIVDDFNCSLKTGRYLKKGRQNVTKAYKCDKELLLTLHCLVQFSCQCMEPKPLFLLDHSASDRRKLPLEESHRHALLHGSADQPSICVCTTFEMIGIKSIHQFPACQNKSHPSSFRTILQHEVERRQSLQCSFDNKIKRLLSRQQIQVSETSLMENDYTNRKCLPSYNWWCAEVFVRNHFGRQLFLSHSN